MKEREEIENFGTINFLMKRTDLKMGEFK